MKKRSKKTKRLQFLVLALGFVCCVMLAIDWMYPKQEQTAAVDVSSHYAQTVRVEKETPLFEKKDGEYREIGRIFKGQC